MPPASLLDFESIPLVKRISPSRFVSLLQCPLREALAAAKQRSLLPLSPRARVGSIVHRILEKANKGLLKNRRDAETEWTRLVEETEALMAKSWLDQVLLPLKRSVKDLQVHRLRTLNGVEKIIQQRGPLIKGRYSASSQLGPEVWVHSKDDKVAGSIDYVLSDEGGITLRDYKTGIIHDVLDSGEKVVKESYLVQLKLYAALYEQTYAVWPARAEVVPLQGQALPIAINPEDCVAILKEATKKLFWLNGCLAASSDLSKQIDATAQPGTESCNFCQYRPGCKAYLRARLQEPELGWPNDAVGQIESRQVLASGRIRLEIKQSDSSTVVARQLDPSSSRHPALPGLTTGDDIAIFDLQGTRQENDFVERTSTTIYKVMA